MIPNGFTRRELPASFSDSSISRNLPVLKAVETLKAQVTLCPLHRFRKAHKSLGEVQSLLQKRRKRKKRTLLLELGISPPTLLSQFEKCGHCFSKPSFPRAVGEVGNCLPQCRRSPRARSQRRRLAVYNLHYSSKLGAGLKSVKFDCWVASGPAGLAAGHPSKNKSTDSLGCKGPYGRSLTGQLREPESGPDLPEFAPGLRRQFSPAVPCPVRFGQSRTARRGGGRGPRGET